MEIKTVNALIDYSENHEAFATHMNDICCPEYGIQMIGDGHPPDGTTDLDFEAAVWSDVEQVMKELMVLFPGVLLSFKLMTIEHGAGAGDEE